MNRINQFYLNFFGFSPYDYQKRVTELLLSGKNIIISVPTGAGKTWASIAPFLIANQYSDYHFPQKMIYSLPLRTLANSIYLDVTEKLQSHSEFSSLASIQTGEYSNDKYFENDIIFSTIDQTLSNFLSFPLPLSKRQANINAGAIIGSYLVFDEFHLLDPNLSLATTLGMLKLLTNLTRVNPADLLPRTNALFHLSAYAIFTVLWIQCISRWLIKTPRLKGLIVTLVIPTGLLLAVKLFSAFFGRYFNVRDVIISAAAIASVVVIYYITALLQYRKSKIKM